MESFLFIAVISTLAISCSSWLSITNSKSFYVKSDFSSSHSKKSRITFDESENLLIPVITEMKDKAFHGSLSNDDIFNYFQRFEKEEKAFDTLFHNSPSFSDILWALGRVHYYPLNEFDRKSLFKIIESFISIQSSKHSVSDVSNLVAISKGFVGISRMKLQWSELSVTMKAGLCRVIELNIDNMSIQSVANIIHALGILKVQANSLPEGLRNKLILNFGRTLFDMNDKSIANSIYGLGMMQYHRDNFTTPILVDLNAVTAINMKSITAQGISNTLYGLACMEFTMNDISFDLLEQTISNYLRILPGLDINVGLGSSFYSMAKLGMSLSDWKPEDRQTINKYLESSIPQMSHITIPTIFYSLGRMNLKWQELPASLRNQLIKSLGRIFSRLRGQGIANTLQGLSLMNVKWSRSLQEFPFCFQFIDYAVDHFHQMQNKEFVSTILSLGRMEFDFLSYLDVDVLISELVKRFSTFSDREVANVIYGLSLGKFRWKRFSFDQNQMLQSYIAKRISQMTEQGYSNTLYGLATMGMKWEYMEPHFRYCLQQSIKTGIHEISPYGLYNSLYGLSLLGLNWKSMRQHDQERVQAAIRMIIESMNELSASYALFSLGVIEVAWKDLQPLTMAQLCAKFNETSLNMTIQEIGSAMYGLALLSYDFPYDLPFKQWSKEQQLLPHFQSTMLLWYLHTRLLFAYKAAMAEGSADHQETKKESLHQAYGQISIYLEFMKCKLLTAQLVEEVLGRQIPSIEVSSSMSERSPYLMRVITAFMELLNGRQEENQGSFSIVEEYDGLRTRVCPMDIAIFYLSTKDEVQLVSFIEVDGSSHYTGERKKHKGIDSPRYLRRADLLKESLYRFKYPTIPIYRIPVVKLAKVGTMGIVEPIANQILLKFRN